MPSLDAPRLQLEVDGRQVEVPDDGASLLEVLRDRLGIRTPKDGCSPQGQCGCCTVLVDGSPRVSCVTPARRVAGRQVTTLDGLDPEVRAAWANALTACGGSQCGFCTPGIVVRLEAVRAAGGDLSDEPTVERALAAHLCRCTGWRTIIESAGAWGTVDDPMAGRDLDAAQRRAALEGRTSQQVGVHVALGDGGFADDGAPDGTQVALLGEVGWVVAPTMVEARAAAGAVQGRRTTVDPTPPIELPAGEWDASLQTTWIEPAYLETDASWCAPGGSPADPLANGGAFGGKDTSPVGEAARRLADERGAPVRVVLRREDVTRRGPKRPPVAGGVRSDGIGVLRVARTAGIVSAVASLAPGLEVEEVDVQGPPTSVALRAAGWAEAAVLLAGAATPGAGAVGPPGVETPVAGRRAGVEVLADGAVVVTSPDGAVATASLDGDGSVHVRVDAGEVLDAVVLRSYAIGAAHQALSWVTAEGIAVDADGEVLDLTIRSFGVLKASATPRIDVEVLVGDGPAVNGSDAVLAAVAGAIWRHLGCPTSWPTRTPLR